ncbi:hypothetical protein Taro_054284 [Colocasia esculenta]|uniref:Uncharacterized protein n=1 Tax=Colocasia esculenta TaxID=4460 RepID=A0A843XN41_COLES|nr:hypothetical protein [Colocasia esculenta]
MEKLQDTPLYQPIHIKKDIFKEYDIDMPYHQAWLRKDVAYKSLHDNFAKYLRGKYSQATKDTLLQLLSQVAYALRVVDFEKVMREIRELNIQAEILARGSNPNY